MGFQTTSALTASHIQSNWPDLVQEVIGDGEFSVGSVTGAGDAGPSDLCFAHQESVLKPLTGVSVGIIVAPVHQKELALKVKARATILSSSAELLMVKVLHQVVQKTPDRRGLGEGIHPTALIHASAEIDPTATIGPYAVVGEKAKVGKHSLVGAHCHLGPEVVLGEQVTLHPLVVVGARSELRDRVEVHSHSVIGKEGFGYAAVKGEQHRIPHLGRVVLKEGVHIGAGCTLDRGTFGDTVIGEGTIVDNQCHVAHNCKIGSRCVITAHFVMAGSSTIGDYFVCGGKTVVAGHLQITDHVHLAALSAVSKSITRPGAYGGYPLQPLREFLKTKALSGHLLNFKKDIDAIKKQLNL